MVVHDFIASGVEASKEVKLLKDRLRHLREPYVKAVVMFGSRARGEAEERSDVDLLVLHDGCDLKDSVLRRRHLYNLVRDAVGEHFEGLTILDMELKHFLKPRDVTALLLNIYWDALVVHDETGTLQSFLKHVKKRIMESGLKRVRNGTAYYWVLPRPMREVKIL